MYRFMALRLFRQWYSSTTRDSGDATKPDAAPPKRVVADRPTVQMSKEVRRVFDRRWGPAFDLASPPSIQQKNHQSPQREDISPRTKRKRAASTSPSFSPIVSPALSAMLTESVVTSPFALPPGSNEMEDSDDAPPTSRHALAHRVVSLRSHTFDRPSVVASEGIRGNRMPTSTSKKSKKRRLGAPPFKPLTAEENAVVDSVFLADPRRRVVGSSLFRIYYQDLHTLMPNGWLNDTVVEFRLRQIEQKHKHKKVKILGTFFYTQLTDGCVSSKDVQYEHVSKWTADVDVFSLNKLIVPIHTPDHWTACVFDFTTKELLGMDSQGVDDPKVLEALSRWLVSHARATGAEGFDASEWSRRYLDVPRQSNGSDCGVFCLEFCEAEARDAPDRGRLSRLWPSDRVRRRHVLELVLGLEQA